MSNCSIYCFILKVKKKAPTLGLCGLLFEAGAFWIPHSMVRFWSDRLILLQETKHSVGKAAQ